MPLSGSHERADAAELVVHAQRTSSTQGVTVVRTSAIGALLGAVKRRVPWWFKIGAKITLSRLPFGYARWRALNLFVHGGMHDAAYARQVFDDHFRPVEDRLPPAFTMLELGPGDSVASALLAAAAGNGRTWLVDAGDFATRDIAAYRPLIDGLLAEGEAEPQSFDTLLARANAVYLTDGLTSLRSLDGDQVDFIFSEAVLEHVRLAEFEETVRETFRLLRPGGMASHLIDLQDHLADSLHSLRFRRAVWESDWFARSGFYTNRLRAPTLEAIFAAAGFKPVGRDVVSWPRLPVARSALNAEFAGMDDDALRTKRLRLLLRKPA